MSRYIDADAMIDEIEKVLWDWKTVDGIMGRTILKQVIQDIKSQPTADVQKIRHGKWLHKRKYVTNANGEFKTFYFRICSECGKNPRIKRNRVVNYCPWCGAEMEDSDAEIH